MSSEGEILMQSRTTVVAALFSWLLFVPPALAQQVPDESMVAIGGDIGLFVPTEEFEPALTVGGLVDVYATPRIGIRGSVYWTNPQFDRGTDDSVQQVRLGVDGIYNWEGGRWHPFVGAGIGAHMLELKENGREVTSATELGGSLLGGVEYFLRLRTVVKAEARYNFVSDFAGTDPSGLALMIGLKQYF
jgi:hypothetical protein